MAQELGVPVVDVHNMIADRYDREGPEIGSTYFHNPGDPTHRNRKGAAVDAELTLAGLKTLYGAKLDDVLSEKDKQVPAADAQYVIRGTVPVTAVHASQ